MMPASPLMKPLRSSPVMRPFRWCLLVVALVLALPSRARADTATCREYLKVFKTYAFSEPDPVPRMGGRMGGIYPYFRFDG